MEMHNKPDYPSAVLTQLNTNKRYHSKKPYGKVQPNLKKTTLFSSRQFCRMPPSLARNRTTELAHNAPGVD
jgi:hypothetical protein